MNSIDQCELSVIVPTFNEVGNVQRVVQEVAAVLQGINWEIIFVDDDSPDGTYECVLNIASANKRVSGVQRKQRKGLSSACIDGMHLARGNALAVIDADLQHDINLLRDMLLLSTHKEFDLVVGSRYSSGGNAAHGLSFLRGLGSRGMVWLSRLLTGTKLKDPMSGFFLIRRSAFESVSNELLGRGFKILLDLVSALPKNTLIAELPYSMKPRLSGASKLNLLVLLELIAFMLFVAIRRSIPYRFILFSLVGAIGLIVHFAALSVSFFTLGADFIYAQSIATLTAMTSNYFLNNHITYRDRLLKGMDAFLGLIKFYVICSAGALISIGLSTYCFQQGVNWMAAGAVGVIVAAVWNFSLSTVFTWAKLRESSDQ